MFCGNNKVAGQGQLKTGADCDSVDCRDDRLVQVPQFSQPRETAWTIVLIFLISPSGGFQVPSSREELVTRAGDDCGP